MDDATFTELMTDAWGGDVLTGSLWWETAEAEDRQGRWWSGPQEDREDETADRHDEWVEDWNRTVRGHYRDDHPFPIDPTDGEVQW